MRDLLLQYSGAAAIVVALIHGMLGETKVFARATIEPPRLRTLDRSLATDLETICHKAIEKEPSNRYQTAAHVAAEQVVKPACHGHSQLRRE